MFHVEARGPRNQDPVGLPRHRHGFLTMEAWIPGKGRGLVPTYNSREAITLEADSIYKAIQGYPADYSPVEAGVQVFEAAAEYADVRNTAAGFPQEGGFLAYGLNQSDRHGRFGNSDWEAREAGTGTDVDQDAGLEGEVGGDEERFSEVAADDLTRIADRGQVDLSVPLEE